MAVPRGERRSHRRRVRGGVALLVLAAALAPLLIGSRAQPDSATPALATSNPVVLAADVTSAEAAWPGLTDPGRPPPGFTDRLERPRTPTAQGLLVPATAAHEVLAGLAPPAAGNAAAVTGTLPVTSRPGAHAQQSVTDTARQAIRVTQTSPVTSPSGVDRQQSVAGAAQQTIRGTQTEYTWEDGDRTLTVTLQTDLAIEERTGGALTDALAATPRGNVVRSANSRGRSTGLPVFRSPSDSLMTLPGGVLLLLDQDWGGAEVKRFFADNAISTSDVSELGWIDNGYFIETAPGFPSLRLANALAGQEGVEISSPNWWQQVELK